MWTVSASISCTESRKKWASEKNFDEGKLVHTKSGWAFPFKRILGRCPDPGSEPTLNPYWSWTRKPMMSVGGASNRLQFERCHFKSRWSSGKEGRRRQAGGGSVMLWVVICWEILGPGIYVDVTLTCTTCLYIHPFKTMLFPAGLF